MKTVLRIEEGMDRREIYATTSQMRPPGIQFYDNVANEGDAFNYWSLARAADLLPRGGAVLDLCCGRGLLIPFLRYRNRQPSVYVGVDLEPKNAKWKDGADPRHRGGEKNDWHFPTVFVESSVADTSSALIEQAAKDDADIWKFRGDTPVFDLVVFTSAIEHMQPDAQQAALQEAALLAANGAKLYLTCPVTPEDKDGYDCQYAAHIYEPKESELLRWLTSAGWAIVEEIGLVTKVKEIKARLGGSALEHARMILNHGPREFALVMIAQLYPECATEKAFICQLGKGSRKKRKAPPPRGSKSLLDFAK